MIWDAASDREGKVFLKFQEGKRRINSSRGRAAQAKHGTLGPSLPGWLYERNPRRFLEPFVSARPEERMYFVCFHWKGQFWNAGNFSTEMEGNIRWIILLFLFSVHNCEGKTETKKNLSDFIYFLQLLQHLRVNRTEWTCQGSASTGRFYKNTTEVVLNCTNTVLFVCRKPVSVFLIK